MTREYKTSSDPLYVCQQLFELLNQYSPEVTGVTASGQTLPLSSFMHLMQMGVASPFHTVTFKSDTFKLTIKLKDNLITLDTADSSIVVLLRAILE